MQYIIFTFVSQFFVNLLQTIPIHYSNMIFYILNAKCRQLLMQEIIYNIHTKTNIMCYRLLFTRVYWHKDLRGFSVLLVPVDNQPRVMKERSINVFHAVIIDQYLTIRNAEQSNISRQYSLVVF